MVFTSFSYLIFLLIVFVLYWSFRNLTFQNLLLLFGSYIFYGFVHPWFCYLIAFSTVLDYFCGRMIRSRPDQKRLFLILSLATNLGMLGFFKYFNFFVENLRELLLAMGYTPAPFTLEIFLPVGISFYTFQTLSYTIDIYRGKLEPHDSFLDFAVFVSFFPQLVAGPIERATRFLPQVARPRKWNTERFLSAFPLIVWGLFKKLVIADNMAIYVEKVYLLESPSKLILLAGTMAFSVQIFADFSAYTDIARGTARLLGFKLIENFDAPYLAISPSDFWRRWHISFSTWIRDYLYIPLGGSRQPTFFHFAFAALTALGLSGLWHGAAWNFVFWGVYHGILIILYRALGMGGRWRPATKASLIVSWLLMLSFTIFGWGLFRTVSIAWYFRTIAFAPWGLDGHEFAVFLVIVTFVTMYSLPILLHYLGKKYLPLFIPGKILAYASMIVLIMLLGQSGKQDFIYFQF